MKRHTFKFRDDDLNRKLIGLLNSAGIAHEVDEDGVVHYAAADQAVIEDDLICAVRDQVFPAWQLLTSPRDGITRYRDYMDRREVPFIEEQSDGKLWFLIPRKYRPHSWKLDVSMKKARLVAG